MKTKKKPAKRAAKKAPTQKAPTKIDLDRALAASSPTDKQLRDLRDEGIETDDWRQVDVCDIALGKRKRPLSTDLGPLKDSSGRPMTRAKARAICAKEIRSRDKQFRFRFTLTHEITLRENEIYPDYPWHLSSEHLGAQEEDDLTVAVIMKTVAANGGAAAIIRKWNLGPDVDDELTIVNLDVEAIEDSPNKDDASRGEQTP